MEEHHSPSADPPPTEEEIRAYEEQIRAYEEELKTVRVEDVLVQSVVSLLNVGAHKLGLAQDDAGAPGAADPIALEQSRLAIDGARALLAVVDGAVGDQPEGKAAVRQLREALSQLQLAYAAKTGGGAPAASQAPQPPAPDQGTAQSSSRLWVPGQ